MGEALMIISLFALPALVLILIGLVGRFLRWITKL
jgi:hypothetical protein